MTDQASQSPRNLRQRRHPADRHPHRAGTARCARPGFPRLYRAGRLPRNIPVNFHWTGAELVVGAFAGTFKIAALRAHPAVAVTIATHLQGAKALLLRGEVTLSEVDGLLEEYAIAHRRTMGEQASRGYLAAIDRPGLRMVRITLRPQWAGMLDFASRIPERTPAIVREALA